MTLVDVRTNLAKDVISAIRTHYGMKIRIFDAQIPVAVKAAEAAKAEKSIYAYDPEGKPAKAYEELTREMMKDAERQRKRHLAYEGPLSGLAHFDDGPGLEAAYLALVTGRRAGGIRAAGSSPRSWPRRGAARPPHDPGSNCRPVSRTVSAAKRISLA